MNNNASKNNASKNNLNKAQSTIIVGGGWAGLSSAVQLKKRGIKLQLFEASRQLGGRARGISYQGYVLDNGQHILLGSCLEIFALFKLLGIQEAHYLHRQVLNLDLLYVKNKSEKEQNIHIHPANIIAPLHLLIGFLTAKGIDLKDKYFLIKLFIHLKMTDYQLAVDQGLLIFLQAHQQSLRLIKQLWEPLCLAVMNTPISTASAQIFFNVLKLSFDGKKTDSELLLFTTTMSKTLADHAYQYLKENIHLKAKIDKIEIAHNQLLGIKIKQQFIACSELILATPLHISQALLAPFASCQSLVFDLKKINYQPIYTLYLCYLEKFTLSQKMTGVLNGYAQWVFDKSFTQQQGLLAVIISGPGKHQQLNKEQLIKQVNLELQSLFTLPKLDWGIVVVENKATIDCSVKNNQLRPDNSTPIKGLYLAGDYTNTAYPSTLEGAVISGKKAAELVI